MLPKKNRLLFRQDFSKVHYLSNKENTKYFTPLFSVYYTYIDASQDTKVGFVLSKKFHKSAVVRNKYKRIFRELVRESFDKIKPGYLISIHPKRKCLESSYEEISVEFNKFISKNIVTN